MVIRKLFQYAGRVVSATMLVFASQSCESPGTRVGASERAASWCTVTEPTVRVGTREDVPLYRVTGAHRFSDGRLAVASAGTYQVLFFTADGDLVRSVGREGDGPGEFRDIRLLASFAEDSLLVFDARLQRATILSDGGAVARSYGLPLVDGQVMVEAVRSTGAAVGRVSRGYNSDSALTGVYRPMVRVLDLDRDGQIRGEVGRFPGDAAFVLTGGGGMIVGPLTFGGTLHLAATDSFIVMGHSDGDSLHLMGSGVDRRLAPIGLARLPATDADFATAVEQYLGDLPEALHAVERARFDVMPRVDSLPRFADLVTDASGRIWLRRQLSADDPRQLWVVLDPRGALVAEAQLPDGTRLLEVGVAHAVLLERDPLGQESVTVVPLARTGCPSHRA